MNFFDRVKGLFKNETEEKQEISTKENDIGGVIAPVFREIPPDSKGGKFLTEGLRSWAYIAITAIADEISTTDLNLFKKQGKDWVIIDENQALDLIEKPNNFQTKEEFLWLTSVFLLAEGEAPWYLDSPKNPTQMVLINPYNLSVIYDSTSLIGGYNYRQSNGTLKKIDKEQIVFLKLPNFQTPFRGMGIMKYIAQTLDIDNFIEEYLKLFFYNDTTPGAVLQTDMELNKTIIQRLKTQFQVRHQGVKNSHKLAVLEKGLKYQKISSNINELQLKELNDLTRDKVLAAFKVPKSVLGIVEDVNRASAESSSYSFAKRAVVPKLKLIEGQLNQFLIPKFSEGQSLWFEFENPVPEDMAAKATYWVQAINAGWMTANEVRGELGLDPLEEEPDEEEDIVDNDEEDKKPAKSNRKRRTKSQDGFVEIMKDILESEKPNIRKEFDKGELIKYHDDKIMFLDHLERDYKEDLHKNFRRQKRKLLEQLKGKSISKSNSINLTLDEEEEVEMMMKISSPHLLEAIKKESQLAYAILGLQDTLGSQDEIVNNFIKKRTLKLGKGSTQTTQEAVDRIVRDWTEKGGSWTELRSELSNYFDDTARADVIARTELAKATGFAQQEVYQEAGAVAKKWITAQDEMVCEGCAEMDGQIVDIMDNYFDKGDSLVTADGKEFNFEFDAVENAELHPNCFVGETRIVSPDAEKITRVMYSGKIVKLTLADGTLLSVTPNHPILTQRGFISAGLLKNTDKVVKILNDERIVFSDPDNDASPATISDVFITLQKSSGVNSVSMPVTAKDFHGDGQFGEGEVNIVSSDSFLRDTLDSSVSEPIKKAFFNGAYIISNTFQSKSDFATHLLALALASDGIVSGDSIQLIFSDTSFAHHQAVSLKTSSNYDRRIEQSLADGSSIDLESFSQTILGFSPVIAFNDIVNIEIDSLHNDYVYDVSSYSTLYTANGVVSSNCRCDIIAVFEESKSMKESFKKKMQERKEKIELEKEKLVKLDEKEKRLNELELKLIDKEAGIIKQELELEKDIEEVEKIKKEI